MPGASKELRAGTCKRDAPVYKILFTRTADKTLRKLPADIAQRIRRRLDNIAMDPYAVHLDVTKLQNRSGYRLRVGLAGNLRD